MKNFIPIIGLGFLAFYLYRKFNRLSKNIKYKVYSAMINSVTVDKINGEISFLIMNPENVSVQTEGVEAEVYYNNVRVAVINHRVKRIIQANGDTILKVPIIIPLTEIKDSISSLLQNFTEGKKPVLNIYGKILFVGGSLDINISKTFS